MKFPKIMLVGYNLYGQASHFHIYLLCQFACFKRFLIVKVLLRCFQQDEGPRKEVRAFSGHFTKVPWQLWSGQPTRQWGHHRRHWVSPSQNCYSGSEGSLCVGIVSHPRRDTAQRVPAIQVHSPNGNMVACTGSINIFGYFFLFFSGRYLFQFEVRHYLDQLIWMIILWNWLWSSKLS